MIYDYNNLEQSKKLSEAEAVKILDAILETNIGKQADSPVMAIVRTESLTDNDVKRLQNELAYNFKEIVKWKSDGNAARYHIEIEIWNARISTLKTAKVIRQETAEALLLLPTLTTWTSFQMHFKDVFNIMEVFVF